MCTSHNPTTFEGTNPVWGIDGHAYTGAEIAEAARRELAAS
jgi:hypothetical protein